MATSEKSGKPKKVGRPKRSSTPKIGAKKNGSKKGGNFLGAVGELVAPAGWGSFTTAAALVGIGQADAAFRRKKTDKSSVKKGESKMSGGGAEGNKNPIDILIDKYKTIKNSKNRKIPVNYYNNAMSYLLSLRKKKNMPKFESELKRFEEEEINYNKFYRIPLYISPVYDNNTFLRSVTLY
jgi:hypothetical protein